MTADWYCRSYVCMACSVSLTKVSQLLSFLSSAQSLISFQAAVMRSLCSLRYMSQRSCERKTAIAPVASAEIRSSTRVVTRMNVDQGPDTEILIPAKVETKTAETRAVKRSQVERFRLNLSTSAAFNTSNYHFWHQYAVRSFRSSRELSTSCITFT